MHITHLKELGKQASRLHPALRSNDKKSYITLRNEVIIAFLPHGSTTTHMAEKARYNIALANNNSHLESVLYGDIWDDLQPNERLAIEHLYYENPALVGEGTILHHNIHHYATNRTRPHLTNALWEILYNSPALTRNRLECDKAKRRRKAQATLLNSLNIPLRNLPTPDYIVASLKQYYTATPLEELLPDIIFPFEATLRSIEKEIQQINAEMLQQILGKKSIVSDATTTEEATDAFTELATQILHDVRKTITTVIDKHAAQGKTEAEIIEQVEDAITHYQDTTIPHKMNMLATHFNGKLSEVRQREAGYKYYIWVSQDDPKVRPDHAANDQKLFSWDNPPLTGHPGEDYNCRCIAQPHTPHDPNVIDDAIEPIYPIEEFIIGGIAIRGAARLGKAINKIFKNPTSKRPKGVPKDWKKTPSKKKDGYKYGKPGKEAYDDVRVQKGNPNSPNPSQQNDYVKWKKDGKYMDKKGNKVPGNSPEAHIPIDEFQFDKDVFK